MKVLVTGVKGQLGGDVVACLEAQNVPCWGVDIDDFDLTDQKAVRDAVLGYAPDVIVHCAAYTAVDKAEDEGREICRKVNVEGTRHHALRGGRCHRPQQLLRPHQAGRGAGSEGTAHQVFHPADQLGVC